MVLAAPAALTRPFIDVYQPGDEHEILACMQASFGDTGRLDRWRHLHLANPAGPSETVVARGTDGIVGQIANLRRHLRFFAETHTVAHAIDTMVHPTWQHRGVFQELVAAADARVAAQGLHVSYGVANDVARRGSMKYEHRRPLGAFPVMVRPLRPLASLAALVRHHLVLGGMQPTHDVPECAAAGPLLAPADAPDLVAISGRGWSRPSFDHHHTRLFAAVEGLPPIAFVREGEHLAWRYPASTGALYAQRDLMEGEDLAATAVVRVIDTAGLRLLLVMEWHWRTDAVEAGRTLGADVVALARRAGCHAVAAMAGPGTLHRRVLGGLGFVAVPARAFPQQAWPGVHTRSPFADDLRWSIGRNWYFTWGDGLVL